MIPEALAEIIAKAKALIRLNMIKQLTSYDPDEYLKSDTAIAIFIAEAFETNVEVKDNSTSN